MGKIGFRIRSKVNKQVSIYVYLYGPFKTRLEAKTGFVVLRDEWDIKKMRARISDENGVRLNGYLDQLERHLVFQYNNLHSSSQEFTRGWLESQISACFNRPDKDNRSKLTYQIRRYLMWQIPNVFDLLEVLAYLIIPYAPMSCSKRSSRTSKSTVDNPYSLSISTKR